MKRTALTAALAMLFAVACEQKTDGGDKAGADKGAAATPASVTDDQIDNAPDLPVEEDYEEEAAKEITEENLDEKVAALEKEIGAE